MFTKILVANRGEIAIRAFRAAYELGAQTVAVFPYEDRNSFHRLKADEAYQIGAEGHPVRAYLSVDEIIRVAKEKRVVLLNTAEVYTDENGQLQADIAADGCHFTFSGYPRWIEYLRCHVIDAGRYFYYRDLIKEGPEA